MPEFISILDFPHSNDRHESTRDMHTFIHTHDELRRYRDFLVVTVGPTMTYDHLTYALYRPLKNYFHENFEMPYLRLRCEIEPLATEALMAASYLALAEKMGATDRIREREHELLQEITGGVGHMSQGFFPDHWDALDRLRRLYAMRAALLAQEIIPAVPKAAEILSREFGGDVALPRFGSDLTEEQRLEFRSIAAKYPPEEVVAKLEECMPPSPPAWDEEPIMEEICQAVIRTYLDQVEDDEFMDAWIQKIRPELGLYGHPSEKTMRDVEAFLADEERSSRRRFRDRLHAHVLEWIEMAEACGHPIDPRALRMAGYQEARAASAAGSPQDDSSDS